MADSTLHAMTNNTNPQGTDELYLLDDPSGTPANNRISVANLLHDYGTLCVDAAWSINLNPADSTTYYYGLIESGVSTTANQVPVTIRRDGTIFAIDLLFNVNGTLSSAETFTTRFRLNNTTDTTISSSCVMTAVNNVFSNTALNISITEGDTFEIKFTTPAWATNPTTVRGSAKVWMR